MTANQLAAVSKLTAIPAHDALVSLKKDSLCVPPGLQHMLRAASCSGHSLPEKFDSLPRVAIETRLSRRQVAAGEPPYSLRLSGNPFMCNRWHHLLPSWHRLRTGMTSCLAFFREMLRPSADPDRYEVLSHYSLCPAGSDAADRSVVDSNFLIYTY